MKINPNVLNSLKWLFALFTSTVLISGNTITASELSSLGLHVIPCPREVKTDGEDFVFPENLQLYWTRILLLPTGLLPKN